MVGDNPATGRVQHRLDLVTSSQGQLNQFRSGYNLSFTQLVEGGLKVVGKARNVVETEHCASTLNRVQRTEGAVYGFEVVVPLAKLEKS